MVKLFANEREIQAKRGIMLILSFFTLLATNLFVIYLAHLAFPTHIVLGTFALTSGWALWLSVCKLSVLGVGVMPLVTYYEWKKKTDFRPQDWLLLYFFINAISLYAITRFAEIYGLGVSSWVVILGLAAILDLAQGFTMMALGKIKIN